MVPVSCPSPQPITRSSPSRCWPGGASNTAQAASPGMNPFEIMAVLQQNAAELLVPDLVDFLLIKLRSRLPALVDTSLASSTKQIISTTLRSRLQNGKSIKNLAGILEEILAESVDDTHIGRRL